MGHNIYEVSFGLVGDIQLEEFLGYVRVKSTDLLAEGLEQFTRWTGQEVWMVFDRVLASCLFLPVSSQNILRQSGNRPDFESHVCQPGRTLLDGLHVPMVELTEALVQPQRAVTETTLHITLLMECAVTVLRVVPGKRQVAQRVQPSLLDLLPIGSQVFLPFAREFRILWQDVFDRELVDRDPFLAIKVLYPPKPVAASREVVQVTGLQITVKLLVPG